mmetsp:Transcript_122318/g.237926  ORF Transcript_122318/g.237926 Transcript_122318/m.237926 type:complete len:239 (+) Transcript_122318:100-816(+)
MACPPHDSSPHQRPWRQVAHMRVVATLLVVGGFFSIASCGRLAMRQQALSMLPRWFSLLHPAVRQPGHMQSCQGPLNRRSLAYLMASLLPSPPVYAIMGVNSRREFTPETDGVRQRLPGRARILQARKELQHIDDDFVELFIEDKGAAVRKRLKKVSFDLGPLPALARQLVEEPDIDVDKLMPLLDNLGSKLALAQSWTTEADNCWNSACNVQVIDEARDTMLDAIGILMLIEKTVLV